MIRGFVVSWVLLAVIIGAWGTFALGLHHPGMKINWSLIGLGLLVEALPNIGVLWLICWGLFLACEPGMGFQTRLSGFRATRPLTVGTLAGMRTSALVLAWLCVWLPLVVLQHGFLQNVPGMPPEQAGALAEQASNLMARRMACSANAMIAALPLLLWGRLEGFPTVFLATLAGWAWTWSLSAFYSQEPPPEWLSWALGTLLVAKLATAAWALLRSYRGGYVNWQFPTVLFSGWLAVVLCMLWLFPAWQSGGIRTGLALAVMIPLARVAACPLTMAANRHG